MKSKKVMQFVYIILATMVAACGPVPVPPPIQEVETVTFTPTPTLTPTETFTPTVGFTPTPTEPPPSTGYTIYDNFDKDTGRWEFRDNWVECQRQLLQEFGQGVMKFECLGSATERVNFTIGAFESSAKKPTGIEMAFYTLPLPGGKTIWGKYQILTRFGGSCDKPERQYIISIRPNDLTFIEADSKSTSINPPSPTKPIGTLEPHVIRIELKDNLIHYYLDNVEIRNVAPLANTTPVCWMFQSQDNNKMTATGYRGIVLQWIALKP